MKTIFNTSNINLSKKSAYFGLLLPLVMLLKPQVRNHIQGECIRITAGTNNELIMVMEKPCKLIAESISDCLIKESERSGKLLSILSDLISRKYGDSTDAVAKKCTASFLGLPENTLDKVPMAVLINAMQGRTSEDSKSDMEQEMGNDPAESTIDELEVDLANPRNSNEEIEDGYPNDDGDKNQDGNPNSKNKNTDVKTKSEDTQETTFKKEMPRFQL